MNGKDSLEHNAPFGLPGPGPEGPDGTPPMGRMMVFRRALGGPTVVQGPGGQTETWQPEELVASTDLAIEREPELQPTAQAAEQSARKVQGQWTTYLMFRKSILGVGFVGPARGGRGFGPNKHGENDRFARLTPEQRVERARELVGAGFSTELPGQ